MRLDQVVGESLDPRVTLTLTRRDVLLLKLCLRLVDRDHIGGRALCSFI
jgi:hypothetical protein